MRTVRGIAGAGLVMLLVAAGCGFQADLEEGQLDRGDPVDAGGLSQGGGLAFA